LPSLSALNISLFPSREDHCFRHQWSIKGCDFYGRRKAKRRKEFEKNWREYLENSRQLKESPSRIEELRQSIELLKES